MIIDGEFIFVNYFGNRWHVFKNNKIVHRYQNSNDFKIFIIRNCSIKMFHKFDCTNLDVDYYMALSLKVPDIL